MVVLSVIFHENGSSSKVEIYFLFHLLTVPGKLSNKYLLTNVFLKYLLDIFEFIDWNVIQQFHSRNLFCDILTHEHTAT